MITGVMLSMVSAIRADTIVRNPPGALPSTVLLEVWINGHSRGLIIQATKQQDDLWVSPDALTKAGLRLSPDEVAQAGYLDLARMDGIAFKIAHGFQRLLIVAAPSRMPLQVYDLAPVESSLNAPSIDPKASGFVLNYDVTINAARNRPLAAGALLQGAIFSKFGVISTSGVATGIGDSSPGAQRFVRLDSALDIDQPDKLRRISIGDAITGGLSWSRIVRFGGVHIASDYSLQPDTATLPLLQYLGSAVVPSTLDVYVDAARVLQTNVDTGPFDIRNLPVVTGSGQVQVVLKDILGRETVETLSTYASSQVLRKGLSDYSIDVGALRRGYGLRSFDYGAIVSQASLRYGLTDAVTLHGHAEYSRRVQLVGGGVVFLLPFASVEAAAALSHGDRGDGQLVSLSVESQHRPLSLFMSYSGASRNYADLGSLYGPSPLRSRLQMGAQLALPHRGALAASWVAITPPSGQPIKLLTSTYSQSLGDRGLIFNVSGLYNDSARTWSVQAFISIPLGVRGAASASLKNGSSGTESQVSLSRNADPDGGWGYNFYTVEGAVHAQEASATWVTEHGLYGAGLSSVNGNGTVRASASGALVIMDGDSYLARQTGGAFAVVKTGSPDVHIYRENREVAVSNKKGKALLVDLVPFASNRIAIAPADYTMDTVIEDMERIVAPRRAHGIVIDLAPRPVHPLLIDVRLEDGTYPTPGTPITFDLDQAPLVVGQHGQVFFMDMRSSLTGEIVLPQGICRFRADPPPPISAPMSISVPIVCIKVSTHVR